MGIDWRAESWLGTARNAVVCLAWVWVSVARADYQGSQHVMAYNDPPISYSEAVADDPVARLQARLEKGEVKLRHDDQHGYLLSVLEALNVPVSSQMLVFSKTSLHRHLISPEQPRAVFFNDDVYVGWVRWAPVLEVSAVDPHKGGMFYVLSQEKSQRPRLVRNNSCLECHVSGKTLGVPGHLIRSFEVDEMGMPDDTTGGKLISHNTPMAERWGGWYVTGRHGKHGHLGNLFGEASWEAHREDALYRGNLTDLSGFIDTNLFPRPDSDIVALLVFEHQVHMHNFLARLNYEATIQLSIYGHVNYLDKPVEAFVRYLLFADEPPILGRIRGQSEFAEWFQERGPKDSQGRSLRDLNLYTRLFQYPCSYLIYSEAFDGLPGPLRERIARRLFEILDAERGVEGYEKLTPPLRRAVREILRETKPELGR